MCSLALFPPPLPYGQTTVCESNNELLSGSSTEDQLKQDFSPPSLSFPRESLKLHSRTENSSKAAFLDHSETLWMRSAAAWRDGGLTGLLNEITNSHPQVPKWFSMSSGCILALLRWVSSFHGSLFPHLTVSSLCSLIIFHLIVSRFWVQIQVFLFNYILIVDLACTRMWTCERWPCIKGRCQSGCWSPDGSRLLFTVQGETVIYALTFTNTPGPHAAVVVADLSETTFNTPDGDIVVGGEIQSLAWDPRGERLAVLLKGITSLSNSSQPYFFLSGEPGAEPRLMQFHPNFRHGALLTVCWSSGRITHVPFYFLSASIPRLGPSGSPTLPHVQERPADFANQSLFTELIS
uniref:Achalasia, adrenocortical insufficiency, alacrimia n=1 Tax=Neolamprologus brichardi TaxID=32507 RepID=A0A3Q4I6R5_NEOBR